MTCSSKACIRLIEGLAFTMSCKFNIYAVRKILIIMEKSSSSKCDACYSNFSFVYIWAYAILWIAEPLMGRTIYLASVKIR